ncbi:hypothetical protein A2U01_0112171, partial [Trifolium medium]|nr:hypothetical protein [Trifolium medium]
MWWMMRLIILTPDILHMIQVLHQSRGLSLKPPSSCCDASHRG